MAQLVGNDDIESLGIELSELGRSFRASFRRHTSSFRNLNSSLNTSTKTTDLEFDEETVLQWAAIDRLPTFERLRSSLFDPNHEPINGSAKRVVDVRKLNFVERRMFIEKLIKHIEHDNLQLLQNFRKRIDKVGVELPTIEVRYRNLRVQADCEVVQGKPLPTLWNTFKSMVSDCTHLMTGLKSKGATITILDDVSGEIKPGRMTLLLGPPSCGKTTLLKALSGNIDKSLKVTGDISYNGYKLDEFVPQKTSAYISQTDLHIPEITVRETLDFSARCQGIGSRADIISEVIRREKEAGILPNSDIDTYMKAVAVEGQNTNLQTDYILKILGLDICADTLVGDAMRRGISGGQKKRLTTGEMIVGPTKALFMDEISNGLDSSTTYQIIVCLQQLAHITDATVLVALLQPAPETFDLFDDIILMAEGKIVYHGKRDSILEFFEQFGFKCPERKGVADYLQEVISRKDQQQYWYRTNETYSYVSISAFSTKFKESYNVGKDFTKSNSIKQEEAISFNEYSLSKWDLFKACMSREVLLMKRNSFVYVFKTVQIVVTSVLTMTVFIRTRMKVNIVDANYYMGALFFGLIIIFFDGFPELAFTIGRLPAFYKQRDLYFYPGWAYAIPSTILKIPLSMMQSIIWTSLTYYVIGYSPEPARFFRQFILLFALHITATALFRFTASVCRTMVASAIVGTLVVLFVFLFSGFVIPKTTMPSWLGWAFWISPLTYAEIGIAVNEFLAPRWQKDFIGNVTIGHQTLISRGLDYQDYFFWISIGALFGFTILFTIGSTLALSFLKRKLICKHLFTIETRAIISSDKLSDHDDDINPKAATEEARKGRMVLPFEPLTIVFQDVQYFIDTPLEMKENGFNESRLQLLHSITGAFRPGVLTALMGVSGAGKTTLLDVLAGRKTSGFIEGEIKVGGYPKIQDTFARISGYCEQTDIHSPQITVEESVVYSAWLRLHPEIDARNKLDFVKEVLETIELDEIKDSLVGIPGVSGLSTEQRKRLTIAVELVANPSIIFMDEPTTGLDARAAAIVMRAVKNVANTGRTIVCTIHQPSIDIFEAFDELVLLKVGGQMIYSGPLGLCSSSVIEYFEDIRGVPKIKDNYNPATWMLEVTSTSSEAELQIDFAQVYKNSALYKDNTELVKTLSIPSPNSKDLHFPTRFSQNGWGQFKSCLWKQYLSYWRSPSYNLNRSLYLVFASLLLGALYWGQGRKIHDQQSLFNMLGAMYSAALFLGINNSSSVLPYVTTERFVLYRERFAGMYSPWAYALAQVAIEIPYLLAQAIVFVIITYPMIGFYPSAYKIFWYFYSMFCTILYFTYLGMLLVAVTPSFPIAAILQSTLYTLLNLFAGFLIPQPQIPKWWIWLYYMTPTSWTLNAMLTSQYGDLKRTIFVFGGQKSVADFLHDFFGFHHDRLPLTAVVLLAFPVGFAALFALCIEKLNYQRR
ncbi:pleiotropic drug resistance protein 3-like [Impatiens glandulifera]|uniref:pleiotropic drug resistance protein 3-like n=1 Tax=Impatiens glandulifera TaxID=253017 RepID=UPI001FB05D25|nr:pleiotropic drug resistance protein 3-like [Impatiens glandulifera]